MQLTTPTGRYGQLRRGGHVAYADDPHEPIGIAVEIPAVEYGQPLPGTVRVAFYRVDSPEMRANGRFVASLKMRA